MMAREKQGLGAPQPWAAQSQRRELGQSGGLGSFSVVGPLREWKFKFISLSGPRNQQRFFEHVELERKGKTDPSAQAATEDSVPDSGVRESFKKEAVFGIC